MGLQGNYFPRAARNQLLCGHFELIILLGFKTILRMMLTQYLHVIFCIGWRIEILITRKMNRSKKETTSFNLF